MSGRASRFRSFRSRIALRIFLLCAVCSLLPTAVIGVLVYTRIAAAEADVARNRLQVTAKRFGVLLQDRLNIAEDNLMELARRKLSGEWSGLAPGESARLIDVSLTPWSGEAQPAYRNPNHRDGGAPVQDESLRIVQRGGEPQVLLTLTVTDGVGRGVTVSGYVKPSFLWESDVVDEAGVQICVTAGALQLSCSGEPPGAGEALREQWSLFLRSHYGVEAWRIEARQSRAFSEASLASLRSSFPLLTATALLAALLIGSFEVRRTHGPLTELLAAFRSMARGRFTQVTLPKRRDEYARLGRAFNQLSRTLRQQFRLLTTFERMDRAILERPSVDRLVVSLLPRLPRMLGCERTGVLLARAGGGQSLMWQAEDGDTDVGRANCRDEAAALALLQQRWPGLQWTATPIRTGGVDRGALLCGRGAVPARGRALRRQVSGVARRFAVALRNEEREQLLVRQAYYDELTGLPNRRLLQDRVQQALFEADAAGTMSAFLYLDVDRFKTLNDSLGHRAGDALLAQLAGRLLASVHATDTVARLGGDEFAILLRSGSAADTVHIAERILAAVREPVITDGVTITPQASIGIAMYPQDGAGFDELLRNADAAMYRGKGTGGGQAVFFEEQMNSQAMRRLRVESALRRAIAEGGLELFYQPKVGLGDGEFYGVEALMRWTDPELGAISPVEFVPVAEESGLIRDLGRVALEQAVAFCRNCMDEGVAIGHVAVNVSMLQLRNEELATLLQDLLARHRVPPAMVQIEVTESAIMQDARRVSAVLERIRALGIRIAVDDFGTGYSSLAVLQQLPLDLLKLDRAFVATICESPRSLELVRAMLAVAKALGLQTIAEGVETPAQACLLAQHGCDYAQGWLYGKAQSGPQTREVVKGWIVAAPSQPWIMVG
jgi:diguanylate cyclase